VLIIIVGFEGAKVGRLGEEEKWRNLSYCRQIIVDKSEEIYVMKN